MCGIFAALGRKLSDPALRDMSLRPFIIAVPTAVVRFQTRRLG